jgi:hypothetical protein
MKSPKISKTFKFGDRIGKLKRNFKVTSVSTTVTPTTTRSSSTDSDYEFNNDIHRSDDYSSSDDHNKKFFILTKTQQGEISENKISLNNSLQRNSSFQSPTLGNTARLEMLTDFFDVPPSSPLLSASTLRPLNIPKSGVVLAAKNYVLPTNSTLTRYSVPSGTSSLRQERWVSCNIC